MKKLIIVSVIFSFLFIFGCSKKDNSLQIGYLSWSYVEKYHELDLRWKWLTEIPNICKDYSWTILLNIWSIDLGDNQITSIDKDLSCMPYLQELDLSYNQLNKIQKLDKLNNLRFLKLQKNNIKSTLWLELLSNLWYLNLAYNQISKVSWLSELSNLQELELQHNQISDLSRLSDLPNLTSLKLEFNQISDVSQLSFVTKLKNLKRISIGENKLPEYKVIMLQNQINGER